MGIRVLKDHCTKRAAATKGTPGDTLASMLEPTSRVAMHCLGQDCSKGAVVTAVGISQKRRKLWSKQSCLWFLGGVHAQAVVQATAAG